MTIKELKEAAKQIKEICSNNRWCMECPLAIDMRCPMSRSQEADDFPCDWPCDWPEEDNYEQS